ncbi:bifunctional alpha/beta hydrolase/class I SAM-dependent methyltransferase [Neptuniibacter sp. SY11_33]|uniref:bifunctional alpha/beta hydrolase/class I SAM-dependent methyltransferase n=1 Tax=Neptuniibacter sp. SY11_33 TaxID=3398215 RepID=UPI0039F5986F
MNQPVTIQNASCATRLCEELTFSSHDNIELFYRHWPSVAPSNVSFSNTSVSAAKKAKKAVVMFHRGHEHGGRMAHLVDELAMEDTSFFAWDTRGLGKSPGERGHAESFAELVKDVDCFVKHICTYHGFNTDEIIVLGQSVGAVLVSTWVHDYAPKIRAIVLAAPAFKIKLYLPGALAMIATRQKVSGVFTVNSYVKAHHLSHDPERIQSYNQDPLITRPIASNLLLDLDKAAKRCVEDAHAITTPTLTLVSGDDWVVEKGPQYEFMARLGSEKKRIVELPGFFHDTLGEQERERALVEVRSFLAESFRTPLSTADLNHEDQQGASFQKQMGYATPVTGLKRHYWNSLQKMIATAAKLSEGYRIGQETGFDSGGTLDYVYQNKPQGKGWLGRQIDKNYLNSIGWRGIRQRKTNLEVLINRAIDQVHQQDQPVRIVDVAAGQGRYVLDAIDQRREDIDSLLLRDFSEINVEAGAKALMERGFDRIGNFVQGDAFDKESLATIEPTATVAIVSGLYELFPENHLISDSLAGLAEAIKEGGYLIYTNQPWHPQQELIARCLTSHRDGQPWVMRCRSQGEMDQLVEQAGFLKVDQLIDKWGIFTVSIAQRIDA